MENLIIKAIEDAYNTPAVNFNHQTGLCELSGESYIEETVTFYKPIMTWLEKYTSVIKKPLTFNFRLTYFNTSSSKSILNILKLLKGYEEADGQITVNWHFEEDDIDLEEEIEDLAIITGLDINMITY